MKQCIIRSKIISKYSVILIFIVATLFTIIKINTGYHSKIDINKSFKGKIVNYTNNEDYTKLEIKGKQESIIAYVKGSVKLNLGDYIEVSGTYKIPSANTIRNNFNYQKYLYNNKIYYIVEASKIDKIQNNNNYLYTIKNIIYSRIDNLKSSNYIKTILLGDNKLDSEVNNSYRINGISHLFSISGFHINFLTSLLYLYLDRVTYNKKIKYIIVDIFLILYLLLCNTPSLLRCVITNILLSINFIPAFTTDCLLIVS